MPQSCRADKSALETTLDDANSNRAVETRFLIRRWIHGLLRTKNGWASRSARPERDTHPPCTSKARGLSVRYSDPWALLVVRRNDELLSGLNLVGITQLVAVRIEDAHVLIRVSVELLADFR